MIDAPDELISFLKAEYDRCQDQQLEEERETAIDRYNGAPYGDEEDGSSQVVSRDTQETVDYTVISILRTVVSGDRIVEFTHNNTEAAHEATETIMYLFMDEQQGYRTVHDWLKAGLLEKNAVAMTYVEEQPPKRKVVQGVSAMALQVEQQKGTKIIEAEQTGEGPEGPIFTVAAMVEQPPKFCDAAVPNEEFYCSPDARTITEAPLKGRRVRKSLSDLIAMGFPRDEVETISSDGYYNDTVSNSRDERRHTDDAIRQGLARKVWWHEDYVSYDLNDDGVAELLYVQRSSDFKIFDIKELDEPEDHPFEDWCPFPMQHRRIGQSQFDKVGDLERINTVLLRQTLNGIYIGNNPSTYVHESAIGENTIEDLLTVAPGRIVRWTGNIAPVERGGTFDPSAGFNAMEFMDRRREMRTGITRLNMGLDEETLNDTAAGQAQLIARGEQVEEYIARNFGNAFARLITKKARLLQRYGKPIMVPIDGAWKQVDPSQWPEDMIARPRIGLGATRREHRIAARREIIGMQAQAMEFGLGIVDETKLYNSAKGFINDIGGIGEPSEFFNEPPKGPDGKPVPQQPKPDPAMAKVQAEVEAKKMELQMKQAQAGAAMQLKQAEAQAKLGAMQQQGAQKAQLDAQKAMFDAELAQARASFEADMAERQMSLDAALEMQKIHAQERTQTKAAQYSASVKKFRDGGKLNK
jgi:hypothetical protein